MILDSTSPDFMTQALLEVLSRMTDPDHIRDLILAWYGVEAHS